MTRNVSAEVDLDHQQAQNQRYGSSHISATAKDILNVVSFFFFQAEDGIRDVAVTGVQTCALPILFREHHLAFGAVHVVTYVRLLPSGRSRACAVRALGRNRAYFLQTSGRRSRAYVVHSSGRRSRTHILCTRGRRRFFLLRTRWGSWKEEVQLQDVMLSRVGLETRVEERQRSSGLNHAADEMKFVPDHRAGDAMPRHRHRWQ